MSDKPEIEYEEHMFNQCPECEAQGKRVWLTYDNGSDYSDPCDRCGCKFGKILVPKIGRVA